MNIEIAGLGFCGLDTLSLLPFIPLDGKVEILSHLVQGGGPSATAIVTAARLGAGTAFIGAIGDDERGRMILKGFNEERVNTDYLQIKEGKESPAAFCWIEKETGKRSIAWSKGSSLPLDPAKVDEKFIASLKLLHLDGHNTEAAIKAAEIAKKHGVIVSLDAGTLVKDIEILVTLSDVCIASEFFALKYTGADNIQKAAEILFQTGCKIAAVTSGEHGVYAITAEEQFKKEAFKVPVVDTTGAGDVFHGAFAFAFIQGWSTEKALEFSSAVAAMKCMKFGGRTGIPTIEEVNNFLLTKNKRI
jgi:sugar/nucleoside kinase (ribokinase family)